MTAPATHGPTKSDVNVGTCVTALTVETAKSVAKASEFRPVAEALTTGFGDYIKAMIGKRGQCRINYGSGGSPEPGPLNSGAS